jgi:outer membrane protein assembly factor BamD
MHVPAALLMSAALALAACSASEQEPAYVERPVEQLYNEAMDTFLDKSFNKSSQLFEEVERQHPYSVWATKSQLMSAYSLYRANKYDQAINAADRFIDLHPGNRDVAYAYYLKGLSYYEQITDVGRDQKITDQALRAFDELVRRFPDSVYARDARLKMDLTHDHLAGKEMEIGRFYLKRGQYSAAVRRFRKIIENYQTTSHVPEALHRLTECYLALGVTDEAQKAAAVLGHNYPGSDWYRDSYAMLQGQNLAPVVPGVGASGDSDSWLTRTFKSIF